MDDPTKCAAAHTPPYRRIVPPAPANPDTDDPDGDFDAKRRCKAIRYKPVRYKPVRNIVARHGGTVAWPGDTIRRNGRTPLNSTPFPNHTPRRRGRRAGSWAGPTAGPRTNAGAGFDARRAFCLNRRTCLWLRAMNLAEGLRSPNRPVRSCEAPGFRCRP